MELNSFLFPAPQSSYTIHAAIGDLLFIPRNMKLPQRPQLEAKSTKHPIIEKQESDALPQPGSSKVLRPASGVNSQMIRLVDIGDSRQLDSDNIHFPKTSVARGIGEQQTVSVNPLFKRPSQKNTQISDEAQAQVFEKNLSEDLIREQIQQLKEKRSEKPPIPCLYLPNAQGSTKLMIYFHGNAEDVGLACEMLDYIRSLLKVHILAVEYPGYGIYDGSPDSEQILEDAEIVYDFLTKNGEPWAIPESQIILFGRSIGTGPATHLASARNPCSLLLMSPFKSIRDIVKEQAGSLLQYVICDRFRNIDIIDKVQCPTFFVHGQRDTLISFRHSQELHYKCGGPSALIMPREMDHNEFDFIDDLIQPFHQFLKQCNITCDLPEPKNFKKQGQRTPQNLSRRIHNFKKAMNEPRRGRNADINQASATTDDINSDMMQFQTLAQVERNRLQAIQSEVLYEKKRVADGNDSDEEKRYEGQFRFPEQLYTPPIDFPKQNTNITLWNWILRKFM